MHKGTIPVFLEWLFAKTQSPPCTCSDHVTRLRSAQVLPYFSRVASRGQVATLDGCAPSRGARNTPNLSDTCVSE